MLNSVKNIGALRDKKNNNIRTLVLSENFFLNKTKTITPPLQVKWSVPNEYRIYLRATCTQYVPSVKIWT